MTDQREDTEREDGEREDIEREVLEACRVFRATLIRIAARTTPEAVQWTLQRAHVTVSLALQTGDAQPDETRSLSPAPYRMTRHEAQVRILQRVREAPGSTTRELARSLGVTRSRLRYHLHLLTASGTLEVREVRLKKELCAATSVFLPTERGYARRGRGPPLGGVHGRSSLKNNSGDAFRPRGATAARGVPGWRRDRGRRAFVANRRTREKEPDSLRVPTTIDKTGWLRGEVEIAIQTQRDGTISPIHMLIGPTAKDWESVPARFKQYNETIQRLRRLAKVLTALVREGGVTLDRGSLIAFGHAELRHLDTLIASRQRAVMGRGAVRLGMLVREIAYFQGCDERLAPIVAIAWVKAWRFRRAQRAAATTC